MVLSKLSVRRSTSCEEERDFQQLRRSYLEMIEKCKLIQKELQKLRSDTLIAKIFGSSAAAVGTTTGIGMWIAGLALAPITLGTSIAISAAGGALTVAGGLTVVGARIANSIISAKLTKELINCQNSLRIQVERAEETLNLVWHIVEQLEKEGNSTSESLSYLFVCMKKKLEWENVDPHLLSIRVTEYFDQLNMGKITTVSTKKIEPLEGTNCALKGISAGMINAAIACADDIVVGIFQAGKASSALAGTITRAVIGGIGAVVGVIFVVIDIVEIVKTINQPDLLQKEIEKVIIEYENRVKDCDKFLNLFKCIN